MDFVLERFNYWIIILLMMGGLYIVFEAENMIKKLVGLGIFQTSVIIFYITLAKTAGGTAPIVIDSGHHGDDHGEGHGAAASHGASHAPAAAHAVDDHAMDAHAGDATHAADAHGGADAHPVEDVVDLIPHVSDSHIAGDAYHDVVGETVHVVGEVIYSNPLPHVLMLTAIVVGVATLSVGLALVVRVREAYGTIEMDDVRMADIAEGEAEGDAA